jgi:DNA-binding transcriptional ArsR family regulator
MTKPPEKGAAQAASAVLAIDRMVHEPARLVILSILNGAEEVDFRFLSAASGLSKGNLSRQTATLAEAGYITIRKYFRGRIPATGYQITATGQAALRSYWATLDTLHPPETPPSPNDAVPARAMPQQT